VEDVGLDGADVGLDGDFGLLVEDFFGKLLGRQQRRSGLFERMSGLKGSISG
jgi:hypothetical protein